MTIGQKVKSSKFGLGVISKIITKSTGYVEVTYASCVKKEMAFNITDENGAAIKSKPKDRFHTEKSAARQNSSSLENRLRSALQAEHGVEYVNNYQSTLSNLANS